MSNNLQTPIFAIDYRLAPDHKFPTGLEDCIAGLFWILHIVQKLFSQKVKKYILIGDSSGGNLVTALTFWLIENNLKLPYFISLCYPALQLRNKTYTPSMLNSFDDPLLNYGTFDIIIKSYLSDISKMVKDPYVSPVFMDFEVLVKMPKMKVYIGSKDPLFDDCVRFVHRMVRIGKDCDLVCFEGLDHGLLSMSMEKFFPAIMFFHEVVKDIYLAFNEENFVN